MEEVEQREKKVMMSGRGISGKVNKNEKKQTEKKVKKIGMRKKGRKIKEIIINEKNKTKRNTPARGKETTKK